MNEPRVQIVATVSGVAIGIVALFAIFSPQHMQIAPWIVGVLAAMGIAVALIASLCPTKKDSCEDYEETSAPKRPSS
jgi:hypothetical protein